MFLQNPPSSKRLVPRSFSEGGCGVERSPAKLAILVLSLLLSASCASIKHKTLGADLKDMFFYTFEKSSSPDIPDEQFDPALAPYIPQFVSNAKANGVIIPQDTVKMLRQLVFVDQMSTTPEPGVMAACTRYYTYEMSEGEDKKVKWMIIEVLKNMSNMFTSGVNCPGVNDPPCLMRELIYHELFHCFMNKGHLPDGYSGIMSPTLDKDSSAVFNDWPGLVEEMFSPKYLSLIPDAS